jgi:hypothetical protein
MVEPHVRAEEEAVRLAVLAPSVRGQARELLDGGVVVTPLLRDVLRSVVEAGDATGTQLWRTVAEQHPDAGDRLSEWLVEGDVPDAVDAVYSEISDRLQDFALRRQIRQLQRTLEELDPVEQKNEYDDVFRKTAELQRKLGSAPHETGDSGMEDR